MIIIFGEAEEVIVGGSIPFVNGSVEVPTGAGLGVELDRQALEKLHQQYLRSGLSKRDDQIEMQKVHPDWTFQKVRW